MNSEQLDDLGFQLSHDLKDPLRSLSLNLDFISQSLEKNDVVAAQKAVELAHSISQKLFKLLDGLMGISMASRAEGDETIDMRKLVVALLLEFEPLMKEQNISVTVGPMTSAHVDYILIQEVWRQLIDNSIRHRKNNESTKDSAPQASLYIDAIANENRPIFFIEDNGQGVVPELVPQLFSSLIRNRGVGLGLVFCRRVIERLGGRIWHERSKDRTRFSFELPFVHGPSRVV